MVTKQIHIRSKTYLMSKKGLVVKFILLMAFTLVLSSKSFSQNSTTAWPATKGKLKIIIDTDAANEVDDQWAIALALGFPERLQIEGFVAAHYGDRGGKGGIE